MGSLFSKTKPTESTELTIEKVELILAKNKLELRSLTYHTPLYSPFRDDVLDLVLASNRPVIVYSWATTNIFEENSFLRARARKTGKAARAFFYAYFERLSEDEIWDITGYDPFQWSGLFFRILAPDEPFLEETKAFLTESSEVLDCWLTQNSPIPEEREVDHEFELIGMVADAACLVWTNPPLLKSDDDSPQMATNYEARRNQLIEQLKEIAEEDSGMELIFNMEQDVN